LSENNLNIPVEYCRRAVLFYTSPCLWPIHQHHVLRTSIKWTRGFQKPWRIFGANEKGIIKSVTLDDHEISQVGASLGQVLENVKVINKIMKMTRVKEDKIMKSKRKEYLES
jgi:hypothetical protein